MDNKMIIECLKRVGLKVVRQTERGTILQRHKGDSTAFIVKNNKLYKLENVTHWLEGAPNVKVPKGPIYSNQKDVKDSEKGGD